MAEIACSQNANAIEILWRGCTHRVDVRDLEAEWKAKLSLEALLEASKQLEDYFSELDDYAVSLSDGRVEDLRDTIVEIARDVAAAVKDVA